MTTQHDEKRALPRRLPTVHLGGVEYFVDLRLRDFRTAAVLCEPIEFVRFDSAKGHRMCCKCIAPDCYRCE